MTCLPFVVRPRLAAAYAASHTTIDLLSIEGDEYLPRVCRISRSAGGISWWIVSSCMMTEVRDTLRREQDLVTGAAALRHRFDRQRREAPGHGRDSLVGRQNAPSVGHERRHRLAQVSGTHSALDSSSHRAPKVSVPARRRSIDLATVSLFGFLPQQPGRSTV